MTSRLRFTVIPREHVHPVTRYGFDPIPGNNGRYWWDDDNQRYVPGERPNDE